MSVLFLDPLVLAGYAVLAVYGWLVWRGTLRFWFGREAGWTALAWPLPAATAALPVVVSVLTGIASVAGVGRDGGMAGTVVYLVAGIVPWFLLSTLPPRWSLPRWARRRLVVPPRLPSSRSGPIGAVHAVHGRGHGSLARWVWRVDGTPGSLHIDGTTLRFRSGPASDRDPHHADDHHADDVQADEVQADDVPADAPLAEDPPAPGPRGTEPADVDGSDPAPSATEPAPSGPDEDVFARLARELGFTAGADAATAAEPSRPAMATAAQVVRAGAIELVLDGSVRWRLRQLRPWRADGLLELEVDGSGTTHLWVANAGRVRRHLAAADGAVLRPGLVSRARRAVGG